MGERADEKRDHEDELRSFPLDSEGSAESDAEFDRLAVPQSTVEGDRG